MENGEWSLCMQRLVNFSLRIWCKVPVAAALKLCKCLVAFNIITRPRLKRTVFLILFSHISNLNRRWLSLAQRGSRPAVRQDDVVKTASMILKSAINFANKKKRISDG